MNLTVPELDLTTATLGELAEQAKIEHRLCEAHLGAVLHHFMRLGAVLNAARPHFEPGWQQWLDEVGIDYSTASKAMRLDAYREVLPSEAFTPWVDARGALRNPSPVRALMYIRGFPHLRATGRTPQPPDVRAEARRLRSQGMAYGQIGELLGISGATARLLVDSRAAARNAENVRRSNARKKAAQKALKREEERHARDVLAKTTGGEMSEAYSLIRRTLAILDRAGQTEAVRHAHKCEDIIVAALRADRVAS